MNLAQFHNDVKEIVRVACENALKKEGFVPDPVEDNVTKGTLASVVTANSSK